MKRVLDEDFGLLREESYEDKDEKERNNIFTLVRLPKIDQEEVENLVLVAHKLLLGAVSWTNLAMLHTE